MRTAPATRAVLQQPQICHGATGTPPQAAELRLAMIDLTQPTRRCSSIMLIQLLVGWVTATLGLWLAANVVRGVRLRSIQDAAWAGALLAVLQWALSGPLFVLLGIGTLGIGFLLWFLTRWIVAALVVLIASRLSNRLHVDSFLSALITAFIVAATGTVVRWLL